MAIFEEKIETAADDQFIASHVSVDVDDKGYFITVSTDPDEGSAMMTLPCASLAHESLGLAIELAKRRRSDLGNPRGRHLRKRWLYGSDRI